MLHLLEAGKRARLTITNIVRLLFGRIFSFRFQPDASPSSVFHSAGTRDSGGCALGASEILEKACRTRMRMKDASWYANYMAGMSSATRRR
jgi:hypothetical protein